MTEIANAANQEPWPSLETASWLSDRAGWVLAVSLLFGFAATVLIIWMGAVKEHHWDLLRETASKKIGELGLEVANANVVVAKANENAAEANKLAADANLMAETEKIERLRLQASLAPRRISPADIPNLVGSLASTKGLEIDIISYEYLETDIGPLARSIEGVLIAAQAKPVVFTPFPGSGWARGVVITTVENSSPETESIANGIVSSLNMIGIISGRGGSFKQSDPIAGAFSGPDGMQPRQKLHILVGSKP